nr:hypothetical protein [Tanacetum cinerariifolium]
EEERFRFLLTMENLCEKRFSATATLTIVPLAVMGFVVGVVCVNGGSKQQECGLVPNVPVADLLRSFQQPVNSVNSSVTVIGYDAAMDDMETCAMSKEATRVTSFKARDLVRSPSPLTILESFLIITPQTFKLPISSSSDRDVKSFDSAITVTFSLHLECRALRNFLT